MVLAGRCFAQNSSATALARQVENDTAVLDAQPTVSIWQRAHPHEDLKPAHYEIEKEAYQFDYQLQNRWCAVSAGSLAAFTKRAAFSYTPSVTRGSLPPLPDSEQPHLTKTCTMQAVWYGTKIENAENEVIRELTRVWGKPTGTETGVVLDFNDPELEGRAAYAKKARISRYCDKRCGRAGLFAYPRRDSVFRKSMGERSC